MDYDYGRLFVFLAGLLLLLHCIVSNTFAMDGKTAQAIVEHYFSDKAKAVIGDPPCIFSGDFNGDGIDDIAILFYPHEDTDISKQVQTSHPWSFSNDTQEDRYRKSLVILHGGNRSWVSSKTKAFDLLDKSGVLATPSFKIIVKKPTDKDFAQHQAVLPLKSNCDLIILPTEAPLCQQLGLPLELKGSRFDPVVGACLEAGYDLFPYAGQTLIRTSVAIEGNCSGLPINIQVLSTDEKIACAYLYVADLTFPIAPGIWSVDNQVCSLEAPTNGCDG